MTSLLGVVTGATEHTSDYCSVWSEVCKQGTLNQRGQRSTAWNLGVKLLYKYTDENTISNSCTNDMFWEICAVVQYRFIFLSPVNKSHKKTQTNSECIYEQGLCVRHGLIYLLPLCHRAALLSKKLLKTHQWATLLLWVTCSFITMNTDTHTDIHTHTHTHTHTVVLLP